MEMGKVVISKSGITTIYAGTQNHGQGHETTYAQVLGQLLGIPLQNIALETGDSNNLPIGGGSHSDRSMRMMGNVLYEISKLIIAKAKPIPHKTRICMMHLGCYMGFSFIIIEPLIIINLGTPYRTATLATAALWFDVISFYMI